MLRVPGSQIRVGVVVQIDDDLRVGVVFALTEQVGRVWSDVRVKLAVTDFVGKSAGLGIEQREAPFGLHLGLIGGGVLPQKLGIEFDASRRRPRSVEAPVSSRLVPAWGRCTEIFCFIKKRLAGRRHQD